RRARADHRRMQRAENDEAGTNQAAGDDDRGAQCQSMMRLVLREVRVSERGHCAFGGARHEPCVLRERARLVARPWRLGERDTLAELFWVQLEVEQALFGVDEDLVAIAHRGDRSADGGF